MEKTLVLIKPDAFALHNSGDIIKRYEQEGFRIVAYNDIIAYLCRFVQHHMQGAVILNITVLANGQLLKITAYYSVKPYSAAFADFHIANNRSGRSHEYVFANDRRFPLVGKNSAHKYRLLVYFGKLLFPLYYNDFGEI